MILELAEYGVQVHIARVPSTNHWGSWMWKVSATCKRTLQPQTHWAVYASCVIPLRDSACMGASKVINLLRSLPTILDKT